MRGGGWGCGRWGDWRDGEGEGDREGEGEVMGLEGRWEGVMRWWW